MPTFKRKKMCAECPFRLGAVRGYLGPLTVNNLLDTVHRPRVEGVGRVGDVGELICHMDIAALQADGNTPADISDSGQMCVGMVRYANSCFKRSRDEELGKFQDELRNVPDDPVIPPGKLECYHTLEKRDCEVSFKKLGAAKNKEFEILLSGERIGYIRKMPSGDPGYSVTARVAGSVTNTVRDNSAEAQEFAVKFCQDNINWNPKEAT